MAFHGLCVPVNRFTRDSVHRLTYDAGPTRDLAGEAFAMCGFRPCVAGQVHRVFTMNDESKSDD